MDRRSSRTPSAEIGASRTPATRARAPIGIIVEDASNTSLGWKRLDPTPQNAPRTRALSGLVGLAGVALLFAFLFVPSLVGHRPLSTTKVGFVPVPTPMPTLAATLRPTGSQLYAPVSGIPSAYPTPSVAPAHWATGCVAELSSPKLSPSVLRCMTSKLMLGADGEDRHYVLADGRKMQLYIRNRDAEPPSVFADLYQRTDVGSLRLDILGAGSTTPISMVSLRLADSWLGAAVEHTIPYQLSEAFDLLLPSLPQSLSAVDDSLADLTR